MKRVLSYLLFIGALVALVSETYVFIKAIKHYEKTEKRLSSHYNILNKWLAFKNAGLDIVDYFKKNNYCKIAIYGAGDLCSRLLEELQNSDIQVMYCIDKEANKWENLLHNVELISPDELNMKDSIDVVVVTQIHAIDEIRNCLNSYSPKLKIISLEEVFNKQ